MALPAPAGTKEITFEKSTALCDGIYKEILIDLNKQKENLPHYQIAIHTIVALNLLERNYLKFSCRDLKHQIHECGLVIHNETCANLDLVRQTILAVTESTKKFFTGASLRDRLRFYHCALNDPGCFEHRMETINGFMIDRESNFGILKQEAMIYRHLQKSDDPIPISDFIAHLVSSGIDPESLGIDKRGPASNPDIQILIKMDFLAS
jgi:hypothetical protein